MNKGFLLFFILIFISRHLQNINASSLQDPKHFDPTRASSPTWPRIPSPNTKETSAGPTPSATSSPSPRRGLPHSASTGSVNFYSPTVNNSSPFPWLDLEIEDQEALPPSQLFLGRISFSCLRDTTGAEKDFIIAIASRDKNTAIKALKSLRFLACKKYTELENQTLLHIIANYGYYDMAELLIRRGANVNEYDNNKQTTLSIALHTACEKISRINNEKSKKLSKTVLSNLQLLSQEIDELIKFIIYIKSVGGVCEQSIQNSIQNKYNYLENSDLFIQLNKIMNTNNGLIKFEKLYTNA